MTMSFRSVGLALLATVLAGAANATPFVGEIVNNDRNYSVIHYGNTGSGNLPRNEWLWFDDGQSISFDFDGTAITSSTAQTFSLSSNNSATAQLTFDPINIVLDGSGGITDGSFIRYVLSDYDTTKGDFENTAGTLTFNGMGSGALGTFNSSGFSGTTLVTTLWGGDGAHGGSGATFNGIGIDLKFTGVAVPEPGAMLLMLTGLLCVGLLRSRRLRPTS